MKNKVLRLWAIGCFSVAFSLGYVTKTFHKPESSIVVGDCYTNSISEVYKIKQVGKNSVLLQQWNFDYIHQLILFSELKEDYKQVDCLGKYKE